jgi:4-amino-4-deoxy-L-arabinose transferase-like glycosyltransferase
MVFCIPVFMDSEKAKGPGSDAKNYIVLAKNILIKHQFSVYEGETGYRETARTPGYPLFIGFSFLLSGAREWSILLLQMILDSLISVFIFFSVLVLFKNISAAFFAGVIYSIHPHQLLYTTQILSEILFTFLLFTSIIFLLFFLNNERKSVLALSGVSLGMATLTRPISFYFFIPVLFILFLFLKKRAKKIFVYGPLFLLSFFLILTPWYIRNYLTFKSVFLSTIGNWNIGYYNAGFVVASKENINLQDAQVKIESEIKERYDISDEVYAYASDDPEICKKISSYGFGVIRRNPGRYLLLHSAGVIHFFLPSEYASLYKVFSSAGLESAKSARAIGKDILVGSIKGRILSSFSKFINERLAKFPVWFSVVWVAISAFQLLIYFFAVIGLRHFWKQRRILFFLFLITILYFAVLPGPVGDPRFRVPVEPIFAFIAGVGMWVVKAKMGQRAARCN